MLNKFLVLCYNMYILKVRLSYFEKGIRFDGNFWKNKVFDE